MTDTPKVFANQVIQLLVKHSLSAGRDISDEDYMAMRVAYRNMGGSWQALSQGDKAQTALLKSVVEAWGGLPGQHFVV